MRSRRLRGGERPSECLCRGVDVASVDGNDTLTVDDLTGTGVKTVKQRPRHSRPLQVMGAPLLIGAVGCRPGPVAGQSCS